MQLILPIFPRGSHLISVCSAFVRNENSVIYYANGLPIYSHNIDDLRYFKLVMCSLLEQKLCTQSEIVSAFMVSSSFVSSNFKRFKDKGPEAFYGVEPRHGKAHKLVGNTREKIQKMLDSGNSNYSIARNLSYQKVRYDIR